MAEEKFKLNNEEMHNHVNAINLAVETYSGFGETPFEDELTYFSCMNTDYLAKLETMIENLNSSNSDLIKSLAEIASLVSEIVTNFETLDEENAANIGSN